MKRLRVRQRPSANLNRGPGESPRLTKYASMDAMGQISMRVAPTTNVTPLPNWSHFDRLIWTSIHCGLLVLLTRTSPYAKW